MATNKRKDAAALFELLDKSTIKVPKSASNTNLKIPSWWSSKSNPSGGAPTRSSAGALAIAEGSEDEATHESANEPISETPKANGLPMQLRMTGFEDDTPEASSVSEAVADEAPVDETPVSETRAQEPRLFDPPPAAEVPVNSPSIRPPGVTGVSMAAVRALEASRVNPPTPVADRTEAAVKALETARRSALPGTALAQAALAAGRPAGAVSKTMPATAGVAGTSTTRVFAPQTRSQGRGTWPAPKPGAFAKLPTWVLWAGAGAAVVMVSVVVIAARSGGGKAAVASDPNKTAAVNSILPILPVGANGSGATAQSGNPVPANGGLVPAPVQARTQVPQTADGQARVFSPGQVTRTPDMYYVVIASTPSQKIAATNAQFLADHGIDVSVEIQAVDGKPLYKLISAQGFAGAAAANGFREKIVKVGRLTDEYKNSNGKKGGWNDALVKNNFRSGSAIVAN